MIRLTWRLARPNLLSSGVLLAAVVVFAVLTERAMGGYLTRSGLGACMASHGDCDNLARDFDTRFSSIINVYAWINLVPMFLGLFWGGPLIARELEQGTHRLVWTQSVGRGRWLAVRLGVFLLGALVVAAALTELMTWWFKPIANIRESGEATFGRLNPDVFDFQGIVPIAYTFAAFALGVAAGAVLKRTLPAMVVTLVVYLPLKIAMQSLRAHFMKPLTISYPFGTNSPRADRGDWILSHAVVQNGVSLDRVQLPPACVTAGERAAIEACATAHGIHFADVYQPLNRFWPFQFIESGCYVGLGAVALAVAAWWIIRRLA
jgi:hypothetical protein